MNSSQPTPKPGEVDGQPKGKQPFNGVIDGGGFKRSMDPKTAKVQLGLIDPDFKAGVARVLMKGAEKYAVDNWKRGMSWDETLNAIERHLDQLRKGELIDPETGESHFYAIGAGAMFGAHFAHGPRAEEYKQFDDRPYRDRKP